jgi:hypothetical protein
MLFTDIPKCSANSLGVQEDCAFCNGHDTCRFQCSFGTHSAKKSGYLKFNGSLGPVASTGEYRVIKNVIMKLPKSFSIHPAIGVSIFQFLLHLRQNIAPKPRLEDPVGGLIKKNSEEVL